MHGAEDTRNRTTIKWDFFSISPGATGRVAPDRMTLEVPQPLADHPDLAVEVTTGTEHWRVGEIALVVGGDGSVDVVNRRAGKEQRFSGRIERDAVDALGGDLAGLELPGRGGPSEPHETAVKVAVRRDGDVLSAGEAWSGRRYEDERLDALLRRCDVIVADVTDGRLPYGEEGPIA